jgi:Zn-dependent M28 family amino/carboxypeptidase
LGDLSQKIYDYPTHVYISTTMATEIIGKKQKKILKSRKKMAKGKGSPVSLVATLDLDLEKEIKILQSNNVIGYIEGTDKKDEYLVVSAHFDHLGKRGDDIYYGADDNGSGSSLLLELAQSFQQAVLEGQRPSRSIVFCWFTGEEKGLLGSKYYAEYPVFPLQSTVVNVNVDMVGRTDDKYNDKTDYTYVIGSDRLSSDLHKINESMNQQYTQIVLDYKYNDEADPNQFYYRSDHYNFARNGVPAIFFFTGTHKDYHRTTDTVDKILFDKMVPIGKLIFQTTYEIANRKDRLVVDGVIKD